MAGRRASAGNVLIAGAGLGVHPAHVVALDGEGRERALQTLTALYRDFLEAGGLDIARQQRCPGRPASTEHHRRAA